jgi:hypothetical protein
MEYPNRTARDKGYLTCPACDLEEDEEVVREAWDGGAAGGAAENGTGAARRLASGNSGRILAGTALLGAAAGLAVALWARRR